MRFCPPSRTEEMPLTDHCQHLPSDLDSVLFYENFSFICGWAFRARDVGTAMTVPLGFWDLIKRRCKAKGMKALGRITHTEREDLHGLDLGKSESERLVSDDPIQLAQGKRQHTSQTLQFAHLQSFRPSSAICSGGSRQNFVVAVAALATPQQLF